MSNFLKKFRKEKKNYKELYEIEVENRKKYEKRYREKEKECIELQKSTGIANLRKQLIEIANERDYLKEDRANLYIQLEDARNELNQLKAKKKTTTRKKKDGDK